MIRLTRPTLDKQERDAVDAVLVSGMLVQGPAVARFEALLAERCDRRFAVAVSSGTAALHLALQVAGVGPGDEVLCPALTWPSPAHAVRVLGATPVLVDVDPDEWNATGAAYAAARTERTRAAILIDQFGNPVRAREITAALPGLPLIEDAACALGSHTDAGPCGSVGLVSCMSFHPRKVITTGEGGVCLTDDEALAQRLRALRNHGQEAPGRFREAAANYRMSELSGALGEVQMSKLDGILEARRALAQRYLEALPGLRFQRCPEGGRGNAQTFGVQLPEGATAHDRDALVAALRARGVEAGLLSYALHRVTSVGVSGVLMPVAEGLADRGFALPLYPGMTDAEQAQVVAAVKEVS